MSDTRIAGNPQAGSGGRRRLAEACVVFALLTSACAEGREPSGDPIRADSAGVSLVRNAAVERVLDWDFERVLVLGGLDEGPAAFFRVFPTSIGVDSVGNLYVLDAGNFTVAVFDQAGRHVRSFGRQGEGPGELGFPSDMAVGPAGDVAVYDFARRALVRFDAEGSFTGTFSIPGPLQRQVALLEDGRVVAAVTQRTAAPDSADFQLLVLGDDTVEVAGVRQFTRPEPRQFSCGSTAMPPYFGPRIVWAAASNRIAFSDDATYSVRIADVGRVGGIWSRDLPTLRSTLGLAAWEVAQGDSLRFFGCTVPAEEAARQFGYADTAPTIQDLAVAPDGAVWVRRRTQAPGELRVDVLDATGAYLGTLPVGSPFPALFRGANEVVTVERDALDRPLVVVYRVHKGPET
jgi:hypothetical protein